jgi:hypothetical protein
MWKIAKLKKSLMKRVGVIVAIVLCIGVTAPGVASAATTPLRPTGLVGNCTDVPPQMSLTFTPGDNGGSPITNYEYSFNNTTWTAFNPAKTTQPFIFQLPVGTT